MVQNKIFISFWSNFAFSFARCEWALTLQNSAQPKKCINVTFIKIDAFLLLQETFGPNTGNMPRADHRGSQGSLTSAQGDVCRICHCESEPGMPLISPCVCAGSLKYVHQACLQQWIKSADTKSCELCKYNFQMTTRIKPFRKVRLLLKPSSYIPSKWPFLSTALWIFLMLCINSAIGLHPTHF